jgi:hypothetical protein
VFEGLCNRLRLTHREQRVQAASAALSVLHEDISGHQNISNTVRYTELSATRFKGLFHD